jgi:uncharacterized protein
MAGEAIGINDADLVEKFAAVRIDHDNKAFYRGWLEKRLLMNRCHDCGRWHHPPKPICPYCWSNRFEPTEVSGRGTVYLLMLLHQGPAAPGVDYTKGPHPVATIELVEQIGLRYTSTVIGIPVGDVHIGMPVELAWIERDGVPFPVFQPSER